MENGACRGWYSSEDELQILIEAWFPPNCTDGTMISLRRLINGAFYLDRYPDSSGLASTVAT